MKSIFPFNLLNPTFYAGLLDDPLLLVRLNPANGSVLFDCGQMDHIAKRVLKSVRTLFISHAHMDHFIGIDSFVRSVLVTNRTFRIYGPPGIARKLSSKMEGYDWNLVEDFFCRFDITEVHADKLVAFHLDGAKEFKLFMLDERKRFDRTIYEDNLIWVEGELCEHKLPVIVFKLSEKPSFQVDNDRLEKAGLKKGPWLAELKNWFHQQRESEDLALEIETLDSGTIIFKDPDQLYQSIRKESTIYSIGYITDIGFTESNLRTVYEMFNDVTLLFCECTFLKEHQSRARESFHLCTDDLNRIIATINPRFFVPMHLSKTYINQSEEMYRQFKIPPRCKLIRLPLRVSAQPLLPADLEFGTRL